MELRMTFTADDYFARHSFIRHYFKWQTMLVIRYECVLPVTLFCALPCANIILLGT
jgi:hypothetical protein